VTIAPAVNKMKISKRQMRKILESSYDYDQDYVMHPTDYVRGAMSILSPEEFNNIGIEKMMREGEVAAMELRSTWPEDEGFGSSDRTYELQGFLEMLGFKTGFPNGTLEVVREGKMKITKRKLKSLIREAIKGHVYGDPSKDAYLDITMSAIGRGDYVKATNAILDSYMMDDTWPEEEKALTDMLAALPAGARPGEVEAVADEWYRGFKSGTWNPVVQGKA